LCGFDAVTRIPSTRIILCGAAVAALAGFAILYVYRPGLYFPLLSFLGIVPFRTPFVDAAYIQTAIDCWQQGVDIYSRNPCDVLGRPYAYSPLWLRATFLPRDPVWLNAGAFALDLLFILSLLCLPPPRRARDLVITLLATVSTTTIFALERANIDLVIFLLAMAGTALWRGSKPQRWAGYALIVLAAALKFYPLALLILTLRERPKAFLVINAVAAACVGALIVAGLPELIKMLPNIPKGSYFDDLFGAVNLPYGVVRIASFFAPALAAAARLQSWAPALLLVVLLAFTARYSLGLAIRTEFRTAVSALPDTDAAFLLTGATLIVGCFFAGQNVGYRGIYLLLVLPGLLTLSRVAAIESLRTRFLATGLLILFLMWEEFFRRLVGEASAGLPAELLFKGLFWLVRELVWWQLIGTLGALLLCLLQSSEIGRYATTRVRRQNRPYPA
jgi:hypothetical protein